MVVASCKVYGGFGTRHSNYIGVVTGWIAIIIHCVFMPTNNTLGEAFRMPGDVIR